MIPSVETYLQKEVKSLLRVILSECYIIDEVLKDFDNKVVETFKDTYCSELNAKHEIDVRLSNPDVRRPFLATYIIQLGEGSETRASLGGVEGTFVGKEIGYRDEQVEVKYDSTTDQNFVELSEEIGIFISSPHIAFSQSDNLKFVRNRMYFKGYGNEHLIGMTVGIQYQAKHPDGNTEPHGYQKGFTASDTIMITSASTNMDTLRCLDAILKVILIMLRQSDSEQNVYNLQKIRYSALAPVLTDGEIQVMGRTTTISYTTSYSVDYNVVNHIKEIVLKGVVKK